MITINLGLAQIRVDFSKTSKQINSFIKRSKYPNYNPDEIVYGLWCQDKNLILIAKDLSFDVQMQVLIHEIAEAFNSLGEFNFANHDKILVIELLISSLLNNRKVIQNIWKVQDAARN